MKAWRPSLWLPIIMIAWGIVITLTGIVENFAGLFTARVFLGITEDKSIYFENKLSLMSTYPASFQVRSSMCRV